ncbi:MAG: hemerythrin family protein [Lachnospiraceae bacterium]|nr:hemerythrin family protein [Lachnospiraceae bacterium]
MTIEFDDTLITKNELIDSQHKELIGRIKKFVDSCEQRDSKVTAINMLDYLAEYTDFHFSAEEKLQEEVGYPGLEDHKKKHEEFKKSLRSLEEFLEESEGPTEAFVEQVKKKVVEWLFNHIKTFDRSVAEYIFLNDNPDRL